MNKECYGSHNSMTYLTPYRWWMKPLQLVAKCQSKTLAEQVEHVGYIDIRLSVRSSGLVQLAHGWVLYSNIHLAEIFDVLETYTGYCRIIWEDNYDKSTEAKEQFIKYCSELEEWYPNVKFVGGRQKSTWEQVYQFKAAEPKLLDKYSSMDKKWLSWCPYLYAKLFNKKNLSEFNESDNESILLMDFI